MAIIFNPFTGQPDFTGGGGSGTPGGAADSIQVNDGAGGFDGITRRITDGTATTTDDATPQTLATIPLVAATNYRILVTVIGRKTVAGTGTVGDIIIAGSRVAAHRLAVGGAVAADSQSLAGSAGFAYVQGIDTPPTIEGVASGNNILVQITGGDAGNTIDWHATIEIDSV